MSYVQAQSRYITSRGEISFTSEAPLEVIKAQSKELKGPFDADKKTFAFTVPVKSFEGFNSPLQREHFNENYMESTQYDKATFNGKIIEQIDFTKDGEYEVRAKGKLNVHGIEQERIIKATISTKDGKPGACTPFLGSSSKNTVHPQNCVSENSRRNSVESSGRFYNARALKLLFTICSLVLGVALHTQTPRFNHHPMGGEWEDTRVNKIYEAGSGLLWFGADRGLFQYDGRNFIFRPSGDSVQRATTAIYEDRQGTLWVGYEDGAVFTKPKPVN